MCCAASALFCSMYQVLFLTQHIKCCSRNDDYVAADAVAVAAATAPGCGGGGGCRFALE